MAGGSFDPSDVARAFRLALDPGPSGRSGPSDAKAKAKMTNAPPEEVLHRGSESDVRIVPGFLRSDQARRLVLVAERFGFERQTSRGPKHGEAYRDHGRILFWDASFAQMLWKDTGLNELLRDVRVDGKVPFGLSPKIRIYRYRTGERFGKHVDDAEVLEDGSCTGYTLLVYLNGQRTASDVDGDSASKGRKRAGSKENRTPLRRQQQLQEPSSTSGWGESLAGGETVFYGNRGKLLVSSAPECGKALLHLHGERCLEHESRPVLHGTKYVLRSDVTFR